MPPSAFVTHPLSWALHIFWKSTKNVAVVDWYDGATRIVELAPQTAVRYCSGRPPVLLRWVLIRDHQGAFDPQALLCTDSAADPTQILEWFVLRWQLEVTPYQVRGRLFQEVRTHLGMETQRQWSDLAIALVRRHLWLASEGFSLSAAAPEVQELPATLYHRMLDSLAYAA